MNALIATLRKEVLLVLSDRVGLLLMYLMPVVLVFVITLVQDSSFRMVAENQISVLIVNDDKGSQGELLIRRMKNTGSFRIRKATGYSDNDMQEDLLRENYLMALRIPAEFSEELNSKAQDVTARMLREFGLTDSTEQPVKWKESELTMFYDPVLQDNYRMTVSNGIYAQLGALENELIMETLYDRMGYDRVPESIRSEFSRKSAVIHEMAASGSSKNLIPNATQHNVPAWSIFAMFFMVVSLGGNIVRERRNGTFVRLLTIPAAFRLTILSKMLVYLLVALTQILLLLLIGMLVFPLIGLPSLTLPGNLLALFAVTLISGAAAVSYAVLIGVYARSQEQANGFGTISIIIFAAIGGIWVPSFVMPEYLQTIGQISPLYWCLKGFYSLFLLDGAWKELQLTLLFLGIFIFVCQSLIFVRIKKIHSGIR